MVGPDLTIPRHTEIFVVGDAAVGPWKDGRPVPGVAQGAIQGGTYAAKVIRRRVLGRPYEPFHYRDKGDVAVIGRLAGVTNIGWLGPFGRQSGFIAWALWLGIHILYLIGFANRLVVLIRWAWSFVTHGRGTRLITGSQPAADRGAEPPVSRRWRGSPVAAGRTPRVGPTLTGRRRLVEHDHLPQTHRRGAGRTRPRVVEPDPAIDERSAGSWPAGWARHHAEIVAGSAKP
jgi:hypothetical protein